MNGTLKVKATKKIYCEICGTKIKREKTFKKITSVENKETAKVELQNNINSWELSDKQKHCSICWSIVSK